MNEVRITAAAAERIERQLDQRGSGLGLRIAVRKTGCSGYGYVLNYADEIGADDVVFEGHGARVVVDSASLGLVQGLTLDFKREGLNEMFHFDNPNAKELCGCGESFTVA